MDGVAAGIEHALTGGALDVPHFLEVNALPRTCFTSTPRIGVFAARTVRNRRSGLSDDRLRTHACVGSPSVLAEGELCFVHLARLLPRKYATRTRAPKRARPRAASSSRTARRRPFDVTPLRGRPVTLANGDWADLATGVTA